MGIALQKLAEEDPTFRVRTDEETGQTIISGMGELHLDIIVDRLLREFNVEANVGAPQVAYKETFTKAVDVDSKYAKQSGGRGQYGHCKVHFTPMDPTQKKPSSSLLPLLVVLFLRNISQQLAKVLKRLPRPVYLADSQFWV